jgi:hypothetical protein
MTSYSPPKFSDKSNEDVDEFIKNYRLYFTVTRIATNNAAGKQRVFALFLSCLKDDAACWAKTYLIGKKWQLNHIPCGNALANIGAVQAFK